MEKNVKANTKEINHLINEIRSGNDIFDVIIEGLQVDQIVKIHNLGTFKLLKKNNRDI